jgi:shikimate kinase/3-dehydroquinate synthase
MRKKTTIKFTKDISNDDQNISLTGLMGSGKSTIGKYLAQQLQKKFIDTDSLIEAEAGKSINEIFAEYGEKHFRQLEKEIIKAVLKEKNQVISLGGGAIIDPENREIIKTSSSLIALVASPTDLYNRIRRRKNRPLINNEENPLQKLEDLWEQRESSYMDSHHQIDTTGKSVNIVSTEIMKALGIKKPKVQEQAVVIPRENFSYKIYFKDLNRINLSSLNLSKKILIVSQEPVAKHYLSILEEKLEQDYEVHTMIVEDGEKAKNFFSYQLVMQRLLSLNFERKDTLVALGGGVVGDLVGFAASTYYRGINYIQVPTTLLSMIDSSVGGKTAINVPEGKNLIGTFYQPHMVHIDVNNLKTLSEKEYRCGLGELVKYALLGARWDVLLGDDFFDFIKANAEDIVDRNSDVMLQVIDHCLKIKAGIVSEDETEKNIRAHLNLGHTFAHALEEVTKYKVFSHGEAVAIGIVCSCYLSEYLGTWDSEQTEEVIDLMKSLGLQYQIPAHLDNSAIIKAFKYDKKNEGGMPKFIIPKSNIGWVDIVSNIDTAMIIKVLERAKI